MSTIDLEGLISPIAPDSQSGEDLEYDPEFRELEEAARGRPEHTSGGETIEGEPPNWKDVRKRAEALFRRTRDLRVGCYLTRALLHTDGLDGLRDGLLVIKGLLENQWDSVYPQLDPDDPSDPTRSNVLLALADPTTAIADLRRVPLVASRVLGTFSLHSLMLATGKEESRDDSEEVPDPSHIDAAFREVELELLQSTYDAAKEAGAALQDIESLMGQYLGDANAPDLSKARDSLKQITVVLADQLEQRGVVDESAEAAGGEEGVMAEGGGGTAGSAHGAVSVPVGEIRSREDAVRMLDRVAEYFERNEPSSPVPLLLRRTKRLVAMNFLDILRDLTPDGVAQAESIGGVRKSEE